MELSVYLLSVKFAVKRIYALAAVALVIAQSFFIKIVNIMHINLPLASFFMADFYFAVSSIQDCSFVAFLMFLASLRMLLGIKITVLVNVFLLIAIFIVSLVTGIVKWFVGTQARGTCVVGVGSITSPERAMSWLKNADDVLLHIAGQDVKKEPVIYGFKSCL